MADRDLVVIGASTGGVEALMQIARDLPADFRAAVLVVLHVPAEGRSNLPAILARSGPLPASHARDGEPIHGGRIYCAPPDHHLVVRDGHIGLTKGPQENLHRPSVDVLFRSAALARDGRTIGVVLSGALDDGASGLRTIKAAGGIAIVQEPADAVVPGMPTSAMELTKVDHVLSASEIGSLLPRLVAEPRGDTTMDEETRKQSARENHMSSDPDHPPETPQGTPSVFGCPDCGGVLWEVDETGMHFRCRIGHAYTARSLLAAQHEGIEDTLWAALRALEEQESLSRRMLDRSWASSRTRTRHAERVEELSKRATTLREFLMSPTFDVAREESIEENGGAVKSESNGRNGGSARRGARRREKQASG
jgi:two-component system, chemotaxis family, protein-glutamate methylesterase/glutaminase